MVILKGAWISLLSELEFIVEKNIRSLYNNNELGAYLKQGRGIVGVGAFNRVGIYFQNKLASDVRSELLWLRGGRHIISGSNPIYIKVPEYKYYYIDSTSGRTVSTKELGIAELELAKQSGLINLKKDVARYKVGKLYDIKDTYSKTVDNKTNIIMETYNKEGIYYNLLDNELDSTKKAVVTAVNYMSNQTNGNEADLDGVIQTLKSLLNTDVLRVLNLIEECYKSLILGGGSIDVMNSLEIESRAEILLNVLEANSARIKILKEMGEWRV